MLLTRTMLKKVVPRHVSSECDIQSNTDSSNSVGKSDVFKNATRSNVKKIRKIFV